MKKTNEGKITSRSKKSMDCWKKLMCLCGKKTKVRWVVKVTYGTTRVAQKVFEILVQDENGNGSSIG